MEFRRAGIAILVPGEGESHLAGIDLPAVPIALYPPAPIGTTVGTDQPSASSYIETNPGKFVVVLVNVTGEIVRYQWRCACGAFSNARRPKPIRR